MPGERKQRECADEPVCIRPSELRAMLRFVGVRHGPTIYGTSNLLAFFGTLPRDTEPTHAD